MKAGQNTIVRWVAKLVTKEARRTAKKPSVAIRALDNEQLRHVGGGLSDTSDLPHKGW